MKRFTYIISLLILILVAGSSCDIIEPPFFEDHGSDIVTSGNPSNILLIDFTGHTCKSCPKAHRMIHQLQEVYGDRIVPIAFHLGYFARTSGDKYTMDFTTDEGSVFETYYEFVSFPTGLVNTLSKESLSPYSAWASESAGKLEQDALISIEVASNYDSSSRRLDIDLNLTPMDKLPSDYSSKLMLAVYVTENHIISWQKDEDAVPMDVENYEHNHVFRTALGSVWGESISLSASDIDKSLIVEKSVVLNESWRANNCSIVAFVYNSATMEVIQSKLTNLELE